jgi:hypothetical protein
VPSSQNAFSGSLQLSIINVSFPSSVIDLLILLCLKLRSLRETRRHSKVTFNLIRNFALPFGLCKSWSMYSESKTSPCSLSAVQARAAFLLNAQKLLITVHLQAYVLLIFDVCKTVRRNIIIFY